MSGQIRFGPNQKVERVIKRSEQDKIKYRNFAVPDFVITSGIALPSNTIPAEIQGRVFAVAVIYRKDVDQISFQAVPRSAKLNFVCEESQCSSVRLVVVCF